MTDLDRFIVYHTQLVSNGKHPDKERELEWKALYEKLQHAEELGDIDNSIMIGLRNIIQLSKEESMHDKKYIGLLEEGMDSFRELKQSSKSNKFFCPKCKGEWWVDG